MEPDVIEFREGNIPPKELSMGRIEEAIRDMLEWSRNNIPGWSPPPKLEDTKDPAFYNAPSELKKLWLKHDGGIMFAGTYTLLSVQDCKDELSSLNKSRHWKSTYLPFAKDKNGGFLVMDKDTGQVFEWHPEQGFIQNLGDTLGHFLTNTRHNMLANFMYIEGDGLVDRI